MKIKISFMRICMLLCVILNSNETFGQAEDSAVVYANVYLEHRVASVDKSTNRNLGLQRRLLKRLRHKENKMLRKLAVHDSALYRQYISQSVNYDSILTVANSAKNNPLFSAANKTIDSLKGLQRFIQNQTNQLSDASGILSKESGALPGNENLNELQKKLNAQAFTDQLIQQHTSELKQLAGKVNVRGLQSIQKDVYYAKEKMKAYKEIADEPDAMEENAIEYLQGTEGFDKYLNSKGTSFGGLGNEVTDADLQRRGYQTKSQFNNLMQQKVAGDLGDNLQQQMSKQIGQYSEKINDIKKKAVAAKSDLAQVKEKISDSKTKIAEGKGDFKSLENPDFKVNKERGKPFWKRIETQYNFQTSRASSEGLKPAQMVIGTSAGYKQNERLSIGLGLALNVGLGQNWQHLKLSYEGISLRAYADWVLIYGFSFQIGYERSFIPVNKAYLANTADPNSAAHQKSNSLLREAFGGSQQTAFAGVMKRYKISKSWNGTFLAGYNFLWEKDRENLSPFLIRFGWGK